MIQMVLIQCGTHYFALEAHSVLSMEPRQSVDFSDIARVDLTAIVGTQPARVEPISVLKLQIAGQPAVLLLEHRARLIQIPIQQLWPLPKALDAVKQHPCIQGVAVHEQEWLVLLDARLVPIVKN